jgi:hypothetical protein
VVIAAKVAAKSRRERMRTRENLDTFGCGAG